MSQIIKETYIQPVLTKHERLVDITATASHGHKKFKRNYRPRKKFGKKPGNKIFRVQR